MSRRHEDRSGRSRKSGAPRGPTRGPASGPSRGTGRSSSGRGSSSRGPSSRGSSSGGGSSRRPPRGSSRRQQGLVVTPTKPTVGAEKDGKVRLNHFLAMAGVCSRRAADGLIAGGRVEVDGEIVRELGTRIDPKTSEVLFDGKKVEPEKVVYVLFNKPAGVVCTNARNEQKKRVIDYLPTVRGRLFTVGRLDLDSEGLIILTNDGAFALEMTHPRFGVPKIYNVLVRGRVTEEDLVRARGGVWLAEGPTSGMRIKIDHLGRDRTRLKVMLREGKNREIRRVFAKLDHPVLELKRVRIGHLNLHGLGAGEWRFLQLHEVQELRDVAKGDDAEAMGDER